MANISREARAKLLELNNNRTAEERRVCPECNELKHDFEFGHKQPLARHGRNTEENLFLVCKDCNRAQGSMTLYEWRRRRAQSARRIPTLSVNPN